MWAYVWIPEDELARLRKPTEGGEDKSSSKPSDGGDDKSSDDWGSWKGSGSWGSGWVWKDSDKKDDKKAYPVLAEAPLG